MTHPPRFTGTALLVLLPFTLLLAAFWYAPDRAPTVVEVDAPLAVRLEHAALPDGVESTSLLVEVRAGEAGPRRPVALALALDASMSMHGNKLANAKRAAHTLVDAMRPEDRLSLLSFESTVQVGFADRVVGHDRGAFHAWIDRIYASGETCVSCGLESAYAAVRRGPEAALRSVVLIGDGRANHGVLGEALPTLAARAWHDAAIRTATIGLGRDYDPDTLERIAGGGGGDFYFAHNSHLLQQLVRREARRLHASAMAGARLQLTLPSGVRLLDDSALALGHLEAGETRRVLLRLRADRGANGAIRVALRHDRGEARAAVQLVRVAAGTTVDLDPRVEVERLRQDAIEAEVAAMEAVSRGARDGARKLLEDALASVDGHEQLARRTAALRRGIERLETYATNDAAVVTDYRANRSIRYELARGMINAENNLNGGAGIFKATELE